MNHQQDMTDYAAMARWAHRLALLCYVSLLVLFTLTTLWLVPAGKSPNPVIWLILVVPLLLFVAGIVKGRVRSFSWLSFVALMYFCVAVTGVFYPAASIVDVMELCLISVLFIASVCFIRWQSRANAAEPGQQEIEK